MKLSFLVNQRKQFKGKSMSALFTHLMEESRDDEHNDRTGHPTIARLHHRRIYMPASQFMYRNVPRIPESVNTLRIPTL